VDSCPAAVGQIGSACNDGDTQTINDILLADCTCAGLLVNCDDADPCTDDEFNGNQCIHTPAPDSDADGVCDTVDGCPFDPLKTAPGTCGCGVPETDTDGDAIADCVDNCPSTPGVQGSVCDDGDANTVNDVISAQCTCAGAPFNDACADATALPVQIPANCPANATAGNNSNSTQDGALPQCAVSGPLGDVWYTFNSGANEHVMITLDHGNMASWGFALYNACTGADLLCAQAPTAPLDVQVAPGTEYLVRVFSEQLQGGGGAFSLCVSNGLNTIVPVVALDQVGAVHLTSAGALQLEWNGTSVVAHLQLQDLRGRVLVERRIGLVRGANGPVMLVGVSPGVYLLRLDAAGATSTRRLMAD
jgi:hypothetical protein